MRKFLAYIILLALISSCNKESSPLKDALIIGFTFTKCCCWGWTIKVDNDTIRANDLTIEDTIFYNITQPIPVKIKLGSRLEQCGRYYYYNLDTLIIIK